MWLSAPGRLREPFYHSEERGILLDTSAEQKHAFRSGAICAACRLEHIGWTDGETKNRSCHGECLARDSPDGLSHTFSLSKGPNKNSFTDPIVFLGRQPNHAVGASGTTGTSSSAGAGPSVTHAHTLNAAGVPVYLGVVNGSRGPPGTWAMGRTNNGRFGGQPAREIRQSSSQPCLSLSNRLIALYIRVDA